MYKSKGWITLKCAYFKFLTQLLRHLAKNVDSIMKALIPTIPTTEKVNIHILKKASANKRHTLSDKHTDAPTHTFKHATNSRYTYTSSVYTHIIRRVCVCGYVHSPTNVYTYVCACMYVCMYVRKPEELLISNVRVNVKEGERRNDVRRQPSKKTPFLERMPLHDPHPLILCVAGGECGRSIILFHFFNFFFCFFLALAYYATKQAVWPVKSHQMSIKFAQKWFH